MREPPILSAARRLASLGLAVHWLVPPPRKPCPWPAGPCQTSPQAKKCACPGKAPSALGWQRAPWTPPEEVHCGYRDGANLGIHTGQVEGAPLQVVAADLDSPEALAWAQRYLLPTPLRTATGRHGGEHWFYRRPGVALPNRAHIAGLALDLRGDGGQAVCAPSRHPSGRLYREIKPWTADAVADLPTFDPAWLREQHQPAPPRTPAGPARKVDPEQLLHRARLWLAKRPGAVSGQGGHNTTWETTLGLVRGFGLDPGAALALLEQEYNPRCCPPWSTKALQHKVAQAERARVAEGYLRDQERRSGVPDEVREEQARWRRIG